MRDSDFSRISQKAYIYATYGVAGAIPFHENLSTIMIALWALIGISQIKLEYFRTRDRTKFQILILPAYYLLTLIALIYTENLDEGFANLEKKVSFFIIPTLIFLTYPVLSEYINRILRVFVISLIASTFICVLVALSNSLSISDGGILFNASVILKEKSFWESNNYGGNYFFHEHLSLFKHSSYYAIYICFAIILVFRNLVNNKLPLKVTLVHITALLYFLIIIFLLSARISFIYLGVIFIINMILYFRKIKPVFRVIIITAFILFVTLTIKLNYRIINILRYDYSENTILELSDRSNSLKRIIIWQIVFRNEDKIDLIGTGPGDVNDKLSAYFEKEDMLDELFDLNAHNQFIESYLGLGIMGLVIILLLFVPLKDINRNFSTHSELLIITLIFFMVESPLERNAYIVFLSFFYPITFLSHRK